MGHAVGLDTILFAIVSISAVHLPVAADHDLPTTTGHKLRSEQAWQPMRSTLVESPASLAGDHDVVGRRRTHHP